MPSFPYIVFQGPMNLDGYDRSVLAANQPSTISMTFLDCMVVRENVFVKEQGVPLAMEADSDDARSCHWVVYDHEPPSQVPIPVATIRLVPFPHEPHPLPGSSWDVDETTGDPGLISAPPAWITDRKTSFHDGEEPYLKLGRLAVIKEFRGKGIADLLVKTAIEWAQQNPTFFNSPSSNSWVDTTVEYHRKTWKGLLCVHAQAYIAKAWQRWGFRVDEEMGTWNEAGITHIGMFQRVEIAAPYHQL